MNQRDQLSENLEDAFMALFMESIAEHEGEKLLEENEQLKSDVAFKAPPELDRRCLRTINKVKRRKRILRISKKAYRVFSKFSVAAIIALMLFTSAYAAFPSVRVSTLNLLIEVSDISTSLTFVDSNSINSAANSVETPSSSVQEGSMTIAGYVLPKSITSGRRLVSESSDTFSSTAIYEGANGSLIIISVRSGEGTATNVNTEDTHQIENLNSDSFKGVIAEQEMNVTAGIADTNRYSFITFHFEGISFASAEEIVYEFINLNQGDKQ